MKSTEITLHPIKNYSQTTDAKAIICKKEVSKKKGYNLRLTPCARVQRTATLYTVPKHAYTVAEKGPKQK